MPTMVLVFCLEYAGGTSEALPGVFASVRRRFQGVGGTGLLPEVQRYYGFRNNYVAHVKKEELTDPQVARSALGQWVETLGALHAAVASTDGAP